MTGALRTGGVTFRHTERVMGTVVSFDVRPQGLAYTATHAAIGEARRLLRDADDVFSLYRDDTPLNRLRRAELDLGQCPGEVGEVLAVCEQARDLSGGWFDPWALSGGFDPTGLVKGWAAQRAAKRLSDAGVGAAMVNAAGDISLFGSPDGEPWRIGIRSPEAADQILCVVAGAGAVATSGIYERGDHIINVHTGRPARGAIAATVCGPQLTIADALATGLVAAGEPGLSNVHRAGYDALIIRADQSVAHTPDFPFAPMPAETCLDRAPGDLRPRAAPI